MDHKRLLTFEFPSFRAILLTAWASGFPLTWAAGWFVCFFPLCANKKVSQKEVERRFRCNTYRPDRLEWRTRPLTKVSWQTGTPPTPNWIWIRILPQLQESSLTRKKKPVRGWEPICHKWRVLYLALECVGQFFVTRGEYSFFTEDDD